MKRILTAVLIVFMAGFANSVWEATVYSESLPAGGAMTNTASPYLDIKANGSEGPISIYPSEPVSITVSLDPGDREGEICDWWLVADTPYPSPTDWFSYVYPSLWMPDIERCGQWALFPFNGFKILDTVLPAGEYTFYFALDDPDGAATGSWWGMDSVKLSVVTGNPSDTLEKYLTENDFAALFPHANEGKSQSIPDAADQLYSHKNIKEALDLKEAFSVFLSEGDDTIKRLELAAILANWAQETTGGWDAAQDGYVKWGLCWYEEVGVRGSFPPPEEKDECDPYCYFDRDNDYQPTVPPSCYPVSDNCFFGRGPIQLSWNGNYGAFSELMYGDMMVLLDDPDDILRDGALAFASGFWFWTTYKGSPNIPNKTCHDVMVEDGAQGFGKVINIVNGGIECNHELPPLCYENTRECILGQKIRHRADHFHYFANYLGVGDQLPSRPDGKPVDTPEWNDYYRAMLAGCIY